MSNEQSGTLVFENAADDSHPLPREAPERGRVSAEHTATLEEQMVAMAPVTGEGDDAQGYMRCEDARVVAQIYRTTADILFGLRDYEQFGYFYGMSQGILTGCSR
jgi:hypothetical protein